jgi:hypothetical protein
MTGIRFTAQQIPTNQKWRLTENMVDDDGKAFVQDRGVYDTPALAHHAVKIIVNKPMYHYDQNGDEIK